MSRVSRVSVMLVLLIGLFLTGCVQEREGEDVLSEPVLGQPTGESVLGEPTAATQEGSEAAGGGGEATAPVAGEATVPAEAGATGEGESVESGGGIGEAPPAEGEATEAPLPSTPAAGEGEAGATSEQPAPQETVVSIGEAQPPAEATPEGEVAAQAEGDAAAQGTQSYTVQAGDTLFSIATQFNTTVEELRGLNNLDSNFITVGQVLTVPGPAAAPQPQPPAEGQATGGPTIHVVKGGEWIYSIARLYNVSPLDIIAANPQLGGDPNMIYPGQELVIPTP